MFGLSKGKISPTDQKVLFHEDFSQKDVSEALVGRKGYSLFALRDIDIPIPEFFIISPTVYKQHLLASFEGKLATLMQKMHSPDLFELEKLIQKTDFDKEFMDSLASAYARLSGFSNAWVSVRSSVVYPQDPSVSFSGLFGTYLNVRGLDHLVASIKGIYVSIFKDQVSKYAKEKKVDLSELQMAVVVQKMIQPEVSGVAYTIDPVTGSTDKVSVEAVFGLGDVITDGSITPDQYIVKKKDLDVSEKHISPQEWMKIRTPSIPAKSGVEEFEKIQISKAWSHQQKLEDRHVKLVAKIALVIEEKNKAPQILEWAWEGGHAWVLQSKSLVKDQSSANHKEFESKSRAESLFEVAADIVKDGKEKDLILRTRNLTNALENSLVDRPVKLPDLPQFTDAQDEIIKAELDEKISQGIYNQVDTKEEFKEEVELIKQDQNEIAKLDKLETRIEQLETRNDNLEHNMEVNAEKEAERMLLEAGNDFEMEFLLTGIGASYGNTTGVLKLVTTHNLNEVAVSEKVILLIKEYSTEMAQLILKSAGIIMDEGGLTSDASILCREAGIPAVVGTGLASAILKENDIVKIDGNVGSIYRRKVVKAETIVLPVTSEPVKAPSFLKGKNDKTSETSINSFQNTATKVFVTPDLDINVLDQAELLSHADGVALLDIDKIMMIDKRHPLSHVENATYPIYAKRIEKFIDDFADIANGKEVVASLGSAPVSQFKELIKGAVMESKELPDTTFGVSHYLANKDLNRRVLTIIKRVRNVYRSRNVSLAFHSPMTGEHMKRMKKEITAVGLARTSSFNVYAVLDRSTEVLLVDEILNSEIDGIFVNMPSLAREIMGLQPFDLQSKYNVENSAVMKLLQSVIEKAKGGRHKIYVMTDNNEALIKKCVELGVYGIVVSYDVAKHVKSVVATEEARIIKNIGR